MFARAVKSSTATRQIGLVGLSFWILGANITGLTDFTAHVQPLDSSGLQYAIERHGSFRTGRSPARHHEAGLIP